MRYAALLRLLLPAPLVHRADADASAPEGADAVAPAAHAAMRKAQPTVPGWTTRAAHCATPGTGSSLTTRQLLSSSQRGLQLHLPYARRGRNFVLVGSSIATALKRRDFDSAFGTLYRKGGTQIPRDLAVKYSQSQIAYVAKAKEAKKTAKRYLGCRSPRYITDKLGEPVQILVSVIDDTGFSALTALREGSEIQPFKERLRLVHAKLHRFPFWIADPLRQILGRWFRTLTRAELAVYITLNEDDVEVGLMEPT